MHLQDSKQIVLGMQGRKIHVIKLESCNSTVGTSRDRESAPELNKTEQNHDFLICLAIYIWDFPHLYQIHMKEKWDISDITVQILK